MSPTSAQQTRRLAHNARGFTLIEMMVVLTILIIVLAIAAPALQTMLTNLRVKDASFEVFASISAARSDAITRNTSVTLVPNGGNWAAGWTATNTGGAVLKTQNSLGNITITGPGTLVYNSTGRITYTPTTANPKPTFSISATGAGENYKRCISIDLSGRPVVAIGACP